MNPKKYLIRYSAEIGTKNKSTRWEFMRRLGRNVKEMVYSHFPKEDKENRAKVKINVHWNNILLESPIDVTAKLNKVHGITSFSIIESFHYKDYEHFKETCAAHFLPKVKGRTYAVRCKKGNNKDFAGKPVEVEVGKLLDGPGKVDLTNPDITCLIEIRGKEVSLSDEKEPGAKGNPLGVAGRAMTLISGGIDSPVAAWRAYHCGIDQDFVYFDLGGPAQKDCTVKISRFLWNEWAHGSKSRFFIIDFLPVIQMILKKVQRKYHNMALKYCFYKAAEMLAREFDIQVLNTGEAIGQVSTQTMINLAALDRVTDMMVLRPLSTLSKEEISDLARTIGTYDMAYKGKEFCAIASKGVVTAAEYEKLADHVADIDLALLQKLVDERDWLSLKYPATEETVAKTELNIPPGAAVIDLRPAEEFQKDGWENAQNIPFQQAWGDYIHWEKDKPYYLVCSEGSSSAILATYMQQDGYEVSHLEGGLQAL